MPSQTRIVLEPYGKDRTVSSNVGDTVRFVYGPGVDSYVDVEWLPLGRPGSLRIRCASGAMDIIPNCANQVSVRPVDALDRLDSSVPKPKPALSQDQLNNIVDAWERDQNAEPKPGAYYLTRRGYRAQLLQRLPQAWRGLVWINGRKFKAQWNLRGCHLASGLGKGQQARDLMGGYWTRVRGE